MRISKTDLDEDGDDEEDSAILEVLFEDCTCRDQRYETPESSEARTTATQSLLVHWKPLVVLQHLRPQHSWPKLQHATAEESTEVSRAEEKCAISGEGGSLEGHAHTFTTPYLLQVATCRCSDANLASTAAIALSKYAKATCSSGIKIKLHGMSIGTHKLFQLDSTSRLKDTLSGTQYIGTVG